jgi:hypothetical protein
MHNASFYSPYFQTEVMLTPERRSHILFRHSDLGSSESLQVMISETLHAPACVQKSRTDKHGIVFAKWHPELHNGKFLLVVVINEPERKWIITAYSSHEIPEGEILWQQD